MNAPTAISGATRVYGIIGHPVAHSLSPLFQAEFFRQFSIDGVYVPFPVEPARLEAALDGLAAVGVVGFNVTVPHKEAVYALLGGDADAEAIGAVNTVRRDDAGWAATNTDWLGFAGVLEGLGVDAGKGAALVFGAGGTARAAVHALAKAGTPTAAAHARMGHAPRDEAVRAVTAGGEATRRVVVLGAGAAGLAAANRLALHVERDGVALEVVLVDASAEHVFAPGFVSVMFEDAEAERFRRPVSSLVRPGVEVVQGRVERIDPARREVTGEPGTLGYDALVVALGAEVGWPGGAPVEDTAPWTAAGAAGGAALLRRLRPGERVVVVPATPAYRCPPAVFDLAVRIRRRTRAEVTVAHPWPRPLAPFGEEPSRRFATMLAEAGVGFVGGFPLGARAGRAFTRRENVRAAPWDSMAAGHRARESTRDPPAPAPVRN